MKRILFVFLVFSFVLAAQTDKELQEKALRIHDEVLTIDTHNDTTMSLDRFDMGVRHEPGKRGSGNQDLIRMKEGGLDASFFAVFVGQGEETPEGLQKAKETAVHALDNQDEKMFAAYPDLVEKAFTPEDAVRIEKTGKRAIFVGMENGYPIGTDWANLDYFYQRGVRYVTICHSADNLFCDSSTDRRNPEDKGMSERGRELVHRMNKLGILVDISHVSDQSFYDAIKESKAPVFASHSSCRAVCDHPRNLNDEQLQALKKNGGVIQICFVSDYIKKMPPNPERDKAQAELRKKISEKYGSFSAIKDPAEREKIYAEFEELNRKYPRNLATVKDLVDHIDHVVKTIGVDYVGLGTDFDGGGGVEGCNDVTEMPNITLELVRRGYAIEDIAKIWGGNFLRVFRKALEVAKSLNG